ncbi:ribosomal maturation YjgA family protein [Psychrobacillus lasiicapitis]|uniref:ribosomal maturation YjgA family protein n=1 Tax=Psychrobacillus lasiicapitis TaxID=1636719 RepID=UPI00227A9E61|nr:DUF2809 domain-containing protein [Psychrobacillus lasiicapitis]
MISLTIKNEYINLCYIKIRIAYVITVATTIFLGLASRRYSHELPPFIAENAGDVIWAMMVYYGLRFLLVRKRLVLAIWISFLFCYSIEFSQLYQGEWIKQIRATSLGALIFGKGFLTVDLFRYAVGILLAAFFDKVILLSIQRIHNNPRR